MIRPHAHRSRAELLIATLVLAFLAAIVIGCILVTDDGTMSAAHDQLRPSAETKAKTAAASGAPQDPALDPALAAAVAATHGVQATDAPAVPSRWTQLSAAGTPEGAGTTPIDFRSGGAGRVEAPQTPPNEPAQTRTVFASMWVWDNPLTTAQDNRGTGYAAASPQALVEFARQHDLNRVDLAAPWVSNQGPIAAWMDETTTALHDAGFEVGVLGGDAGWLDDPALAVTWSLDAISTRPVDYVALSLEPWTLPSWTTDRVGTVRRWEAAMDAVKDALPAGVQLTLDAPYWLATTPAPGGGTLFDAVLARADALSIVTFVDHAADTDGIIALSAPARAAAGTAGIPYLVGLETDTPEVAGGAAFTFYDDGADALVREAELVDESLAGDPLFEGVAVEHYRAWRSLLGLI